MATSTAGAEPALEQNVIRPFGYSSTECGYCKGERCMLLDDPERRTPQTCSKSYGMLADSMTPALYEAFLWKGWRRSGIHLYKPSNFESCCPALTIRLLVPQFTPTKSQQKVWKKFDHLLQPPNINTNKNAIRASGGNKTNNSSTKTNSRTNPKLTSSKSNKKRKHPPPTQNSTPVVNHSSSPLSILQATLQQGTQRALTEVLQEIIPQTTDSCFENNDCDNGKVNGGKAKTEKDSSWKILFKPKNLPKPEQKQGKLQLTCSVCAQVAGNLAKQQKEKQKQNGPASPASATISRQDLVELVVNKLRTMMPHTQEQSASSEVRISSIRSHAPSGQIVVSLQRQTLSAQSRDADMSSSTAYIDDGGDGDVIMNDASATNHSEAEVNNVRPDKLAQWYKRMTGKDLRPNERKLTVTTVAAHQSALDPQVHKLYAHYQHVVHQDPDPFDSSQPPPSGNDVSDLQSSATMGDNHNLSTSQSQSTPTTTSTSKDENDDHGQAMAVDADENNADDDADDDADVTPLTIEELDWGNAPEYFTSRVGPMLHSYLREYARPVSDDAASSNDDQTKTQSPLYNAILSNYYSFYQFLVEAPFSLNTDTTTTSKGTSSRRKNRTSGNDSAIQAPTCGTYHQHYKVADVLVAVGVVDILPQGLSSVYLFYHPSFSHSLVALGKYAILKEVEYTRDHLNLPFYYLGYYIESCPKMRYKGDYHPSELLCPSTYQWVPAKPAISKLRQTPRHVCALAGSDDAETTATLPTTQTLAKMSTEPTSKRKNSNHNDQHDDHNGVADNDGGDDDEKAHKCESANGTHPSSTSGDFSNTTTTTKRTVSTTSSATEDQRNTRENKKYSSPAAVPAAAAAGAAVADLNQIHMDIGAGINVTMNMLHPSGQSVVQPVLQELVAEAGLELAKQCLVKLT